MNWPSQRDSQADVSSVSPSSEWIEELWNSNSSIPSDEGLTRETSASESLYGGQFTLSTQAVNKTKLSTLENSQLVWLPPVRIFNLVVFYIWIFIYHFLFTLVLKNPNGKYTFYILHTSWTEKRVFFKKNNNNWYFTRLIAMSFCSLAISISCCNLETSFSCAWKMEKNMISMISMKFYGLVHCVCYIVWSAFHYVKDSGDFADKKSNGKVRSGFFRQEYSGSPLEVVHLFRSEYSNRYSSFYFWQTGSLARIREFGKIRKKRIRVIHRLARFNRKTSFLGYSHWSVTGRFGIIGSTLGTGYTFCYAWWYSHIFPRFAEVSWFPALGDAWLIASRFLSSTDWFIASIAFVAISQLMITL